ncbi:GNAT family N-acetyltransferase [Hahella aquimaris]|uniref:GNAT family N-acetyltransferase n=1 Tax=Hahella sp. HNIBRBA332 TaxID=3015983 RepID=UPI00273AB2D1|nr:GNAT family N-acetyltransferase [Hahella sp. HNIBRBA332]WLQ16695.1 GNAT family N-acetyltransferase [Hahella sp. HNIBRBA332]
MAQIFETERLILRPRGLQDVEACIAMDKDPEVTRYIPGVYDGSEAHVNFLLSRINGDFGERRGYWSIFAKDNPDELLGWVSYIPIDAVGPELEMGWRLVRRAWGKGYATEAAIRLAQYAFEDPELDMLTAIAHIENLASINVIEKLGFKYIHDSEFEGVACKYFELTKTEFQRRWG